MKIRIKKKSSILIFALFIFIITGCSGAFLGADNLKKQYKEKRSNGDIEFYYSPADKYMAAAIRNVSNTFFSGLNVSLECTEKNGDVYTDIYSLSNLKTYYYKELIFKVDYNKCISILLYYTYYPQSDGGFMYRDKFGSIPVPEYNNISVDGNLVIK